MKGNSSRVKRDAYRYLYSYSIVPVVGPPTRGQYEVQEWLRGRLKTALHIRAADLFSGVSGRVIIVDDPSLSERHL